MSLATNDRLAGQRIKKGITHVNEKLKKLITCIKKATKCFGFGYAIVTHTVSR